MSRIFLFFMAVSISFFITPWVKKIANKVNAIDIPKDNRRVHSSPIPRMGGLAIYISFVLVMLLEFKSFHAAHYGLIIGGTIIVIGGILDDIKGLKPSHKLMFQLLATSCLILSGITIRLVTNPFNNIYPYMNLGFWGIPITMLWVIGITNAFNLIDGLDGLAAGVAFISTITLLVVSIINGRYETILLTTILGGAILGFLPYNFHPAKIFMGDTGSQLLGFFLAGISIQGAIKSTTSLVIAVPLLTLGLPIYDTIFAMIRRKASGKPIMEGDKGHLHHRLLNLGLNQREAVLIMYVTSAILGSLAVIAMQLSSKKAYFLLASVVVVIFILAWKCKMFKKLE
ncbi:MraY family glycosyltransferase [Clostridium sp.]|uniref:glycosyltransferase family 4 protein n=1 Tax=Clostridium sp. TaxID=1506 RepID=UPI002FC71AFC